MEGIFKTNLCIFLFLIQIRKRTWIVEIWKVLHHVSKMIAHYILFAENGHLDRSHCQFLLCT